jgi:hypothetical protein
MRRWAIVGAALALGACSQGVGNGFTAPSALDQASDAAHRAADQLVTMSQGGALPPRATDAAAAPLINSVFNTAAVPTTPVSDKELDAVNDWLSSANRVGQLYILAGTGSASITDTNSAAPSIEEQASLNVVTYAPEMGRYFDTELAIMGLEASSLAKSLSTDPSQTSNAQITDGLAKFRGGLTQTASGVIATIAGPGPADDWKEARGKALIAFAPNAAKLLLPADRTTLQALATQAAAQTTDATLKAEFTQFAAAIAPAAS